MNQYHTPGPWRAEQDVRFYKNTGIFTGKNPDAYGNQNAWGIYGDHHLIARLEEESPWLSQEAIDANAHLLAAAPDLLEALEEFVNYYPAGINPYLDAAWVKAKAAIAGAKGTT